VLSLGNPERKTRFPLVFRSLICTFAGDMKRSDKWTNAILVVLVAVLAAICIRSVVHEQHKVNHKQELRDGRDN
jgi:branched-subunit amino acid transport protein